MLLAGLLGGLAISGWQRPVAGTQVANKGLKDYYKAYFPVGVAVSPQGLKGADGELIKQQFNSITPENAMKMGPIHPEENRYFWKDADEIVQFAQASYTVDIWSGNHPFFKGSDSSVIVDEGRVNRFKRRYDGLTAMTDMSTMSKSAPLKPWPSALLLPVHL